MSIHHSNPICDTCGHRHEVGNTSECLDCVLAETTEEIHELNAENAKLVAEIKRLREEIRSLMRRLEQLGGYVER